MVIQRAPFLGNLSHQMHHIDTIEIMQVLSTDISISQLKISI